MAEIKDPENTILIELKDGTVTIELLPDVAPMHCDRMKELAREGAYDNVCFHRVIDGFMAQTGDGQHGKVVEQFDPRARSRAGTGGSDLGTIVAEFSDIPFERGVVGMARSQEENSADAQFFIMFAEGAFLNGQYTVVGRVTEGLDVLDDIKRGDSSTVGVTGEPDHMVSVTVTE
ncbi:Peptidyl-prolyl cis-trans isomerase [Candidatus Rhodobacter oscarellae]|uniref:Peptidyl-prolyl cis-trans isomerase n=1 Tax=Candidatus Rhodobacter oscarellae TaxID=1675527 RepID=A0A0J9E1F1_9RHOB|nr:peptidylprolyl isomerase [Candidatus Rhodobacter lobularis]KMW56716.1 Peptidyl-prolyl cis-trans isomerase [Candidatus Rhodobacter lobularis]